MWLCDDARFSSNLQTLNDQQALNSLPVRASSPIVTAVVQQESRHLGSNGVSQRFQSCPDCLSKFEEECRQMHENESLSLQLAPNKWLPSDDEVTSGGANGAMCQVRFPPPPLPIQICVSNIHFVLEIQPCSCVRITFFFSVF
jgi:hypothetical protein